MKNLKRNSNTFFKNRIIKTITNTILAYKDWVKDRRVWGQDKFL